jgi:hypothetical protein
VGLTRRRSKLAGPIAACVLSAAVCGLPQAMAQETPAPSPPAAVEAPAPAPDRPSDRLPSSGPAVPDASALSEPAPAPGAAEAPSAAGVTTCVKSEFETVVDQSAEALRGLNALKKPVFQDKLRQLKDKRGWTQDQFLKEAAPFVKDTEIDVFDQRSNEFLTKISTMGEEGSAAQTPDCQTLMQLRVFMNLLVDTQNAKWSYMFGKIDAELAK